MLGGTPLTDGRNGGAEPSVWETLLEMERFDCRVGEKDQGAITAFERASLPVVWAWPTRFDLARKLCGCFEHPRRVQFAGCVAEPLQTTTAIFFWSKWSCLLLCNVLQDALSEGGSASEDDGSSG